VTTIRTAVSGAEALARLGEHPAELVLVDTALSRPDTAGFTRRALELAPRAVLLLFGAEEPQVARAAVAAGARGLIRAEEHDPVATVTKALLLLGTPRRTTAGAGPANGTPAPAGSGPSAAGIAPGLGSSGSLPPGSPRTGARPPVPGPGGPMVAGASMVLVPAQRGDPPPAGGGEPAPAGGEPAWRASLTERELQVLRGMAEGKSNAEIGRDLFVSEDTVKTHARRLFRKLRARDRAHAVAVGFRAGALR
jgi:DNA-binding NarL/FixJ family response regulator